MPPSRLLALAVAILGFVLFARDARAEPPGPRAYPVYVLALDTEDTEDQAEALTGALRSRVRIAQGWSLSETTVTLSMLTAALKCPKVPDPPCLTKISEQLKADRFIWGALSKSPGNTVRADIHLWQRNKPEQTATETYTDNLKDQNDERLGRVAQHLFEKLTGSVSSGTLGVHAGDGAGLVFVDGQRRAALDKGDASVELPAGSHLVEVRVQGFAPSRDTVNIVAGKEARLAVNLVPGGEATERGTSSGPSGRRVGGWAAVGLGSAFLITAGVEAIVWAGKQSDQRDKLALLPQGAPACDFATKYPTAPQAQKDAAASACDNSDGAKKVSTLGIVFGAAGAVAVGIGMYLLLSDPGSSAEPKFEDRTQAKRVTKPTIRLVPEVSPRTQGVLFEGTF
jgi:hypothetical protein